MRKEKWIVSCCRVIDISRSAIVVAGCTILAEKKDKINMNKGENFRFAYARIFYDESEFIRKRRISPRRKSGTEFSHVFPEVA